MFHVLVLNITDFSEICSLWHIFRRETKQFSERELEELFEAKLLWSSRFIFICFLVWPTSFDINVSSGKKDQTYTSLLKRSKFPVFPSAHVSFAFQINTLYTLCRLIVKWKRAELRHRAKLVESKLDWCCQNWGLMLPELGIFGFREALVVFLVGFGD